MHFARLFAVEWRSLPIPTSPFSTARRHVTARINQRFQQAIAQDSSKPNHRATWTWEIGKKCGLRSTSILEKISHGYSQIVQKNQWISQTFPNYPNCLTLESKLGDFGDAGPSPHLRSASFPRPPPTRTTRTPLKGSCLACDTNRSAQKMRVIHTMYG